MILLTPGDYQKASTLLFAFKFEPLMQCMIEDIIPGKIYLNSLANPEIAYAQLRHRGYISGNIAALDQAAIFEFAGKQALFEEMRLERGSPDGFLKHSFGIAAFHDNELAGWCLSEYNHDTRCAVGITTMSSFRRMGIAKSMTLGFLNLAVKQKVETVLWHCYKSNLSSARTAQYAGFHLVDEHHVINISL